MINILGAVIEEYLSDTRAVQNGLLGFAFLQSLTFLYSLDKLMPKLSKIMIGTIVGLFLAASLNVFILCRVNHFEICILHQMAIENNTNEPTFLKDLAHREGAFRLTLVGIIGFINILLFLGTAFYYKKQISLKNPSPLHGK